MSRHAVLSAGSATVARCLFAIGILAIAAAEPVAAQNPIDTFGDWIEGLQQKQKERAERQKEAAEAAEAARKRKEEAEARRREEAARKAQPDPIDQRLAGPATARRRLQQVEAAIEAQRYDEASRALHEFLAVPYDTQVWDAREQRHRSAKEWTRRLLADLPVEQRARIAERLGPQAAAELRQAREAAGGVLEGLRQTAVRYPLTLAGQTAALVWARWQLDAGRPHTARRWIRSWLAIDSALARTTQQEFRGLLQQVDAIADRGSDAATTDDVRKLNSPQPTERLVSGGSLSGWSAASLDPPVALPHWEKPADVGGAIRGDLESLAFELDFQDWPRLPLAEPLAVGNSVVWRDIDGLHAADIDSGRGWSRPLADSYVAAVREGETRQLQFDPRHAGGSPLMSVLYRDGLATQISSDGRLAFAVVEPMRLNSRSLQNPGRRQLNVTRDPTGQFEVNTLVAHEVQSGRRVWEIGGLDGDDVFDPPLAGTFFLGPPVAVEGQLYVLAEREGEVALHVLEAATGLPLWSQPLATAERGISLDTSRRQWSTTPTLAGGLVICQTHVGWCVAVDRHSREIAWTQRLLPKVEDERGQSTIYDRNQNPSERWRLQRPIASDSVAFVLGTELPTPTARAIPRMLFAIDLDDGDLHYVVPAQGSGEQPLAICGVHEGRPVLCGRDFVTSVTPPFSDEWKPAESRRMTWSQYRSLSTTSAWRFNLQPGETLTGLPLQVGSRLLLPVSGTQLLTLDLATGREVPNSRQTWQGQLPLGTLSAAGGRLVSQSPQGLAVLATGTEDATNPPDSFATAADFTRVLRAALLESRLDLVRTVLTVAAQNSEALWQQPAAVAVALEAAMQLQAAGQPIDAATLRRLEQHATTATNQATLARLRVEAAVTSREAVQRLVDLVRDPDTLQGGSKTGTLEVAEGGDVWAWWTSTLATHWPQLSADDRQSFLDRWQRDLLSAEERTGTPGSTAQSPQLQRALLLAESGVVSDLVARVARRWLLSGRAAEAEELSRRQLATATRLDRLDLSTRGAARYARPSILGPQAMVSGAVRKRLGVDDAASLDRDFFLGTGGLQATNEGAPLGSGFSGDRQLAPSPPSAAVPLEQRLPPSWVGQSIVGEFVLHESRRFRRRLLIEEDQPTESLRRLGFRIVSTNDLVRLHAYEAATGQPVGDVGLPLVSTGLTVVVRLVEDELYVVTREELFRIDPATFEIVWRARLSRGMQRITMRQDAREGQSSLQSASQVYRLGSPSGLFVGHSRTRLYLQSMEKSRVYGVVAVDRTTGRGMWTLPSRMNRTVSAMPSGLVVAAEGNLPQRLHRESDGRELQLTGPNLRDAGVLFGLDEGLVQLHYRGRREGLLVRRLEVVGRSTITRVHPETPGAASPAITDEPLQLQLEEVWSQTFTAETRVGFPGGSVGPQLVILDGRQLKLLDLRSGRIDLNETLPSNAVSGNQTIDSVRAGSLLLLSPQPSRRSGSTYLYAVRKIDLGRSITAIDLGTQQLLWSNEVRQSGSSQALMAETVRGCPTLVFAKLQIRKLEGQSVYVLSLAGLDVRTGEQVLTDSFTLGMTQPSRFEWNATEQCLDVPMKTNAILRLSSQ